MNFLRLIPFVSLFVMPGAGAVSQQLNSPRPAEGHPYIQQMVDAVSIDSLMNNVRGLLSYGSRYEISPQRDSAAGWMVQRLNRSGLQVESDIFTFSSQPLYAVSMKSKDLGWIAGKSSTLLRTSDGGKNWVTLTEGIPLGVDFWGIAFADTMTGWVVGAFGDILKSSDGGVNWEFQTSRTTNLLYDVGFADTRLGVAVGEEGIVVRTTNGGANWTTVLSGTSGTLRKVRVLDSQNMWAAGSDGTVLYSSDGGSTWVRQSAGVANNLNSIYFVDPAHGWAVGSDYRVLKTTDGGTHWSVVAIPHGSKRGAELQDVCFIDSLQGWILEYDGTVLRTSDGGLNWIETDALNKYGWGQLRRISHVGGTSVVACGILGDIAVSSNGGSSWSRQTTGLPAALMHTSRNLRVRLPGIVTPEKEIVILAHYDSFRGSPGADDNASGTSAVLEAARILGNYQFESTITLLAVSAEEGYGAGSGEFARQAKSQNKQILAAINADMIAYPVTADTTRLVVSGYMSQNRFIDSVLLYNQRYNIGATLHAAIDSLGTNDLALFGKAGYEALAIADATWEELSAGANPSYHKPADTIDKLHPDLLQRGCRLMIAAAAELAKPYLGPPLRWAWQSPFPQWNHLRSVYSLDANTIVAVGDLGTIVKTSDAGRTWTRLVSETIADLRSVWYTTSSHGVAVGDKGTILRTTDGGSTWATQVIDPNVSFYGVCFSDTRTGTAVGYPSAIYRTSNGGTTWISQLSGPAATLRGVCFTDLQTGTIVGSSGTILRTTNGGLKWNRQVSGFEETDTLLQGVSFVNQLVGTVVGRSGTILRTTDGGSTWTVQQSGTAYHLNSVIFTETNTGTAAGDAGIVLRTTDGGAVWTTSSSGVTDWFSGISFTSATTGTAVGSFGTIFHTTDGGSSWALQTQGPRLSLNGVWFTNPTTGTIVGYRGAIFRTTDRGATWVTQASGVQQTLWGVCFADANTAIAVGEGGTILRTTDAGQNWTIQRSASNEWISAVSFASPSVGLAVGKREVSTGQGTTVSALLLRTTNGGSTWTLLDPDREQPVLQWLTGISFGDATTAMAVGNLGRILRSTDGGQSWSSIFLPTSPTGLNSISSTGSYVSTIVGDRGLIIRTTDGGTTWETKQSGTAKRLSSVWFVNNVFGLAVGEDGIMLSTTDRGNTWTSQFSGTSNALAAVHFSDLYTGAIVGDRGTILRGASPDFVTAVHHPPPVSMPSGFRLDQNYPNPFNATTAISYQLLAVSFVKLSVYDVLGREVAVLAEGEFAAGTHRVIWDASRFPSGVYFYRLEVHARGGGSAKEFIETKKLVLLK